jgi:hypothetical protein
MPPCGGPSDAPHHSHLRDDATPSQEEKKPSSSSSGSSSSEPLTSPLASRGRSSSTSSAGKVAAPRRRQSASRRVPTEGKARAPAAAASPMQPAVALGQALETAPPSSPPAQDSLPPVLGQACHGSGSGHQSQLHATVDPVEGIALLRHAMSMAQAILLASGHVGPIPPLPVALSMAQCLLPMVPSAPPPKAGAPLPVGGTAQAVFAKKSGGRRPPRGCTTVPAPASARTEPVQPAPAADRRGLVRWKRRTARETQRERRGIVASEGFAPRWRAAATHAPGPCRHRRRGHILSKPCRSRRRGPDRH